MGRMHLISDFLSIHVARFCDCGMLACSRDHALVSYLLSIKG
jgi:hypothetical protein